MAVKKECVKVDKKIALLIGILILIFSIGCTKTIIVPDEPTDKIVGKATEVVQPVEQEQAQEEFEVGEELVVQEEQEQSQPTIECYKDEDCGEIVYGQKYCFQGDSYAFYNGSICRKPGTPESYCVRVKSDKLFKHCDAGRGEVCFSGECINKFDIECSDTDGGNEPFVQGQLLDINLTQAKDYCRGDWLYEFFCQKSGLKGKERIHCEHGCQEGACLRD